LTKVKAHPQKPLYNEEGKGERSRGIDSNFKEPFSPPFEEIAGLIEKGVQLCEFCSELLSYGMRKRFRCPHNPKPMCKKCHTQCYNRKYKQKVAEVMRFSGPYLIKRGRLDLLYHYLA